ncbi:MAG: hypothetical protein WBP03_02900 [Candidatus Saccharimonadales bacterium]
MGGAEGSAILSRVFALESLLSLTGKEISVDTREVVAAVRDALGLSQQQP